MKPFLVALFCLTTPICRAADSISPITDIPGLIALSDADFASRRPFELDCTLVHFSPCIPKPEDTEPRYSIWLRDATHAQLVHGPLPANVRVGCALHVIGTTDFIPEQFRICLAKSTSVSDRNVPPCQDIEVPGSDLKGDRYNQRIISVEGVLEEVFIDEVDPKFTYLVVNAEGTELHASINATNSRNLNLTVGTTVRLRGAYLARPATTRRFIGPGLRIFDRSDIIVTQVASNDLLGLPECPAPYIASPQEIASWGRRRMTGEVLAVWQENQVLLRTDDGEVHRAELVRGLCAPPVGRRITIGGNPQTDFYHINLTHALWSPDEGALTQPLPPSPKLITDFLLNEHGGVAIKNHGRSVRIRGTVAPPPTVGRENNLLYLTCDGTLMPVDLDALGLSPSSILVGSLVEVSGICMMDIDNWRPGEFSPKIRSATLITRPSDTLHVIMRPSWWTPTRFVIAIAALLTGLASILVWNLILRRLIDRRGRELLHEQIAHINTTLKVDERTRLAVELHDSLSQNLAGVACQIEAMRCALTTEPATLADRILTAKRMLLSCRTELRRCLFDLRGDTLEMQDMNEAIRVTLEPVIGDAKLAMRFNIPRDRLLDTTAHAILCIVRELASNAVRHGQAKRIAVAGGLQDNELLFSVQDDGTGFDTATAPGMQDGHFGLQGIRDRVDRLGGEFSMSARHCNGTYAKISIPLPSISED